jgi:hypothetical protein
MVALRQTHTFAELEVSAQTYDEVRRLLAAAGYADILFMDGGAIDMRGIGLTRGAPSLILPELHSALDARRERKAGSEGEWIGVDLDGTLAHWDDFVSWDHIGAPIPQMVDRVRGWLAAGHEVRVMTARMPADGTMGQCSISRRFYRPLDMQRVVSHWTLTHIGKELLATCTKDCMMIEQWDDRAVQVVTNTGRTVAEEHLAQQLAERAAP